MTEYDSRFYDMESISIEDVVDVKELKSILNCFVLATGLGAICVNTKGEPIVVPDEYEGQCPFCKIVRSDPEGLKRCNQSMSYAGRQAAQLGEPYIFRCHAGLIEFAAPIMFKDVYLGSISCGPVIMWEWDEIAVQEFLNLTRDLNINREALVVASRQVKMLSSRGVQAAARLIFIVANHIAKTGMLTLQYRKELNEQQAKLAEAIFERKRAEETIKALEAKVQEPLYPIDKEHELLSKVRLGDRAGAKEILNDLLGDIFFRTVGNMDLMKARILELVVVVSRAAVEGGASLEKLLGLNYGFISELSRIDSMDEICHWVVKVLDTFMDTMYETKKVRNARSLGEALKYIRENYNRDITLEDVARSVYISPYYLSHLFKEELNITFLEYLTMVRMEEAKKLLKDTSLSIVAVASQVGYDDASYFSKVFKKYVGVTPAQYRKNL
ncbi:two-component system response regulator YesN [Caldicoprobacter guelmensis]|uniref:PocR ligand-binding domain-containing protein n=1 Tax=Caldicoprobacter guelmensis TaxID=1170224 RepID=UPI00195EC388|nr:PocR ligand-binding domain-containing protein [Caldicoprobacter guelmensis]MBM7582351.1 two-component system response regulator YesN [Caldicoprobacter guelmensis]